MRNLSNEFVEK